MALVRVKGYVIGEVIKKSIVPFMPKTWTLNILQGIPVPYVYVVSRCVAVGIIAFFSRLLSYKFYQWIPVLPHSSSVEKPMKVEEIMEKTLLNSDSEGTVAEVINTLSVSTDKVAASVIVCLVGLSFYGRYAYNCKVKQFQSALIEKYNEKLVLDKSRKEILEREEYLKNLRLKGYYWDEEGRILGKVDSVKKIEVNKIEAVQILEKVEDVAEKIV